MLRNRGLVDHTHDKEVYYDYEALVLFEIPAIRGYISYNYNLIITDCFPTWGCADFLAVVGALC